MRGASRIVLLAGALVASVTISLATAPAGATESVGVATVEVQGTLLVAQPDQPGGRPEYAVALEDGDVVPISGTLADARPLSHFTGRLELPGSVVSVLAAHVGSIASGATLGETSDAGHDALSVVDHRSLTLRVSGRPLLTDPARTDTPTTAHRQFVAAITNKGDLRQNDRALLGHVRSVASYWKRESNGAISRIVMPSRVRRYRTEVGTKDCGLGHDFFDIVQEAAAKFPGIDLSKGSDQLVIFVPPSCPGSGVVGEGTEGTSFASGGALIVKTGTTINGTYAHESGHNYGFEHANVRVSGSSMEYYGAYDVMGFALGGYNQLTALSTPFRVFQGITDAGEIRNVRLRSTAVHASATIRPRTCQSGLRSVRVVDPDTGKALYLDYRAGTGEDAGAFYSARHMWLTSRRGRIHYGPGITINTARDVSGVDTLVVDKAGNTSLGAGSTWTNASGNLSIHVRDLGAAGAHVTVRYAPRTRSRAGPRSEGTLTLERVGGTSAT
jgi:hypothetical protein